MAKIKSIYATEILDSRGNPSIETTVVLSDGITGRSSVPAGAVQATYEASSVRDKEDKRYHGMGVKTAISNIMHFIGPALIGIEASEQQKIDRTMIELDGTQNKSKLGSNAILSISQAVMKASARSSLLPLSIYVREFLSNKNIDKKLPIPVFNMIEGGKHSGHILDFQEFLVVPASSKRFSESLEIGVGVYHTLREILIEKNMSALVADEGGFSPALPTNYDALVLIKLAIEKSGFAFSLDAFMGIDAGANSFKDGKSYRLRDKAPGYNSEELLEYYENIFNEFALMYIEDPFAEDDWEGWKKAYAQFGTKTKLVGDDLTTTNPYRLQLALDNGVINTMVVKPSQIGTITETIAVIEIARYKNIKIVISNRSGETGDDFIADFAVGVGADYVKFGAPARERVVKYNRLLEIEQELKDL